MPAIADLTQVPLDEHIPISRSINEHLTRNPPLVIYGIPKLTLINDLLGAIRDIVENRQDLSEQILRRN
jgi:hypothetical protein